MNIRLMGDGDQVAAVVAFLEALPGLRIASVSRPYANRRDPEQMRVCLDADLAIGTRGARDLDVKTVDGRREVWLIIDEVGGYVCAEAGPDGPDSICGMPVESEPCSIHHPASGSE